MKINEATEEDLKELQQMAKEKVWKKWIESPERNGKPAEEILNRFLELIEQYDQEFQNTGLPK